MIPPPLRVGVTGSRLYGDVATLRSALTDAHARSRPHEGHVLIHGMCDPRHPDTGRAIRWVLAKRLSWEVQGRLLGADWLAEWVALDMNRELSWEIERHPADWEAPCRPQCKPDHRKWRDGTTYCPAAGNYRNQEGIVDPGLDVLLAFFQSGAANNGTADCARRAGKAGINVRRFPDG